MKKQEEELLRARLAKKAEDKRRKEQQRIEIEKQQEQDRLKKIKDAQEELETLRL